MPTLELSFECGETSLAVHRFSAREAISEPFSVSILARSRLPDIDIEGIVGKTATFKIVGGTAHVEHLNARFWKGICCSMEQVQAEPTGLSTYSLRIVPKLWLLTQRRGQRIYQHLSIPDIVDKLLAEWQVVPVWRIDRGSYPKLEYKVQYGDTDYAFFCRLLEEAGIAFTFPDEGGTGTLFTLSDKLHSNPPRPGAPLPFVDNPSEASEKEYIQQVRLGHDVRPGASTFRDYDFRNPPFQLLGNAPKAPAPENLYEHYRYDPAAFLVETPGGGDTPFADDKGVYRRKESYGTDLSTRVLESLRTGKRHVAFATNVLDLYPERIFAIDHHPHPELGPSARILVTELESEGTPEGEWNIRGRAVFADSKAPYRPALKTPKPQAYGMQSATVVGPPGEEIHTDEFGRVRVQFPWDREGKNDDNSSCWMRVSQGWAGTGYGLFTIPRVGQEVLVAFLDGDPDAPMVAGRVFNGKQLVPYKLPDYKTVSTWKSSSSPGGGGFNEIKFEDKTGSELVYLQAQKDLHKLVKYDEIERTKHDKKSTTEGNEDTVVKGVQKTLVLSSEHMHVKMNQVRTVDGGMSLTVNMDRQEKVATDYALEAGMEIHLKAGMTMVLEAGMRLTIKGPGGFIDIHPAGIDIVGTLVKINSGGAAGVGKGAHPETVLDAEEANPTP